MEGERLLSTGQAARRLGISVRTLYRWEKAGRVKAVMRLPTGATLLPCHHLARRRP